MILNYTTKIRPERSINEIQRLLGAKGARRISVDYEAGRIVAVIFTLDVSGHSVTFRLPSNPNGVLLALRDQRAPRQYQTREHAEAVSWRIVKDWIAAQLALVEANQAQMSEVFLPYAIVREGVTMFQQFEAHAARGLFTAGGSAQEERGGK